MPQNSSPSPPSAGRLVADAVHDRDVDAVGDRVASAGSSARRSAARRRARPSRCGCQPIAVGIEEHGRAAQRREARALGVPLVPADERADAARPRRRRPEAEVAGREVELLVEERVVRDVHLAVEAGDLAVGVDDRPRCCGRRRARGARRSGRPPRRRPPSRPRPRRLACSGPGPARRGRRARGPPSGRSRACGTARAGRPPRPRARAASRDLRHRLRDVLRGPRGHRHLHEADLEARLRAHLRLRRPAGCTRGRPRRAAASPRAASRGRSRGRPTACGTPRSG